MPQHDHRPSVWTRLKPWKRSPRRASLTRIQRRARDLMSLASIGTFVVTIYNLGLISSTALVAAAPAGMGTDNMHDLLSDWHALPNAHADIAVLLAAWVINLIIGVAPLLALRAVGSALYRHKPLTRAVAKRFRLLAHSLVTYLLGSFVVTIIVSSQIDDYQTSFGLGLWGTLIGILLAYAVAEIIREGTLAAEENRAFV